MKLLNLFAVFILSSAVFNLSVFAQKIKAEEIIAKHLESIGTAEKRAAVKSQIAVGNGELVFIAPKNQSAQGRIVFASAGEKHFFGMSFNSADYPLEKLTFDGKKSKVAYSRGGQRSILGNFMLSNTLILEHGLLGGTLSNAWVLLSAAKNGVKISAEGTKKIDGKEVYVLSYSAKNSGDLDISMFFDKETFRHVRTEYKRISSAGIGRTINESARQSETRLKITENFGDFREESGLSLPHNYSLNYSITGANGTSELEWRFVLSEFAFNQTLEDKTFDAESQ